MYDVQFKHGYVFDAEAGTFHSQDLFVQNGTIVVPKESSPQAKTVVDAQGKYVLPGLIDEHLHLNLYGSMIGANGDTLCIPNGITTACDGGTCGASNFPQFYNSNIIRTFSPRKVSGYF